ncbi:MAG: peptidoglycan DD-metalloendopeptidase family protein [Cellulosilyticaceae bacterium]
MTPLIECIKSKKNKYMIATGIGLVAITFIWLAIRNNAYAITIGDKVIAVVKEKEEARLALEELVSTIKTEEGVDVALNEEVAVKPVHSKTKDINSKDQAKDYLSKAISYNIEAYEIIVDGEAYATVESEAIAFDVLSEIAKKHLAEGSEVKLDMINIKNEEVKENIDTMEATKENQPIKEGELTGAIEIIEVQDALPKEEVKNEVKVAAVEVKEIVDETDDKKPEGQKIERELKEFDFNEEVTIRNTYVKKEEILTAEDTINILLSNIEEMKEYELKEGDNIWDIAVKHGTTMDHILEINPQIVDETKMQIGEKIKLEVPEPILSISTVEQATFKELIPAEIEYVEFLDLYEDETKVYQQGNDGLKEITVNVHKINGKEVDRESVSEKLIKEPKIKVIAYGTKKKPKPVKEESSTSSSSVESSNSGQFMHPLNSSGRVSSGYGSRWGTYHRGIDIAAPAGTPVYASASGTVAYSGYNNGGFGKMIILDHSNGYQTYYAHNSSLYVQVGQSVSKGQNIAAVGSTGNSTGNHVHFEIRKNGTPINPYNYIY